MKKFLALLTAAILLVVAWKVFAHRLPGGTGILNAHHGSYGQAILAQDYNNSLSEPYTTFLFLKKDGETQWASHQLNFEDSRWARKGKLIEENNELKIFKGDQLFASYNFETETLFLADSGVKYRGSGVPREENWKPSDHYSILFPSQSSREE